MFKLQNLKNALNFNFGLDVLFFFPAFTENDDNTDAGVGAAGVWAGPTRPAARPAQ